MTQTLQDALLKAGLITQEKLKNAAAQKKADAQKKTNDRARNQPKHQHHAKPQARPQDKPQSSAPNQFVDKNAEVEKKSEKPSDKAKFSRPARPSRPREEGPKKPGFIEGKHIHHMRTDCEACGKTAPDVEYYQHNNRSLSKYWLCLNCADNNNISDETRQTVQSQHAQSGIFRRRYGATKIFR